MNQPNVHTSGDARAKLLAAKQASRGRSLERLMKAYRKDDITSENSLVMEAYNDGWTDGYQAGFQQALSSVQVALTKGIAAQRSGIMAEGI